jgi:hypothetical protein
MKRKRGVLKLNFFEPWVFPGRLIKMTVNADIFLQNNVLVDKRSG